MQQCPDRPGAGGHPPVARSKAAPYRSGPAAAGSGRGTHFPHSRIGDFDEGTLLALYDARNERDDDLQGDIDIAINRSEDGGRTWQPMQTVLDMKEWGGLPQKYNGVSDGCILSDDFTGDLYVIGLWMHGSWTQDGQMDRESYRYLDRMEPPVACARFSAGI